MSPPEFKAWPKIPRLRREVIVTEKVDGTNSLVWVSDDGSEIRAGSRSRWISPTDDNFGFAKWVEANKTELLRLGPGYHYGEWFGQGIQRGYGLKEKRFALFNVGRWSDPETRPACCYAVPILWRGQFQDLNLPYICKDLRTLGSRAVENWMKPEGVVVYHVAGGHLYKVLLENDDTPKGTSSE